MPPPDIQQPHHILHRRPGLWSLSAKLVDTWDNESRQPSLETLQPTSTGDYIREVSKQGTLDIENMRPDDVLPRDSRVEPGLVDHPDVAKHVPFYSPQLGLQPWMHSSSERIPETRMTTPATLASVEWETETLLEKHGAAADLNHYSDITVYSCPFRKRNPARFNIRDYEACARRPFRSIPGLIHHIFTHHRRQASTYQCRRCKTRFSSEMALEAHLTLPRDQICDVNPSLHDDPEDGIPEDNLRVLVAQGGALQDWWTWESIWQLVFPEDLEVPDPAFQPIVELEEVEEAFDDKQDALKDSLREKLRLLIPNTCHDDYLSFLAGQVELVFETHRANVMKQCRNRVCETGAESGNEAPKLNLGLGLVLDTEVPAQQQKQPAKGPGRSNRRSRRSTLLHSLHHRTQTAQDLLGSGPPDGRRRTTTLSFRQAVSNPKRLSHDGSRPSFASRRTSMATSTAANPGVPILPIPVRIPGAASLTANRPHRHSFAVNIRNDEGKPRKKEHQALRELRDSGISMPCSTCEAGGAGEGCICRKKVAGALPKEQEGDGPEGGTEECDIEGWDDQGGRTLREARSRRSSSAGLYDHGHLERQEEELRIGPQRQTRETSWRYTTRTTQKNNHHDNTDLAPSKDPILLGLAIFQPRTASTDEIEENDAGSEPQQEISTAITDRSPQLPLRPLTSDGMTQASISYSPQGQASGGSGRFSPESFAQRVLRRQRQRSRELV
ncbi:hypothetical protein VTJ83DRAFT_7102 [Remersonia thermophila]|uniref:C2H2-type domain-containing protein n=1 Tax=Remersonia thermophila TaxID=72144 RepID=A0ABR4D2K1_9PEZI